MPPFQREPGCTRMTGTTSWGRFLRRVTMSKKMMWKMPLTFFRNQRADLCHLRRQAGHLFLQPGRQQFVGGLGGTRLLSSAILAGLDEGERTRRPEARVRFQAAARTQARRTPLHVWTCVGQLPRTAGLDRALPHRALLPLCLQPQTALPRRDSPSAVGPTASYV